MSEGIDLVEEDYNLGTRAKANCSEHLRFKYNYTGSTDTKLKVNSSP